MKKYLALIAIALVGFTSCDKAKAQVGLTPQYLNGSAGREGGGVWQLPSTSSDTVVAGAVYFWAAPVSSFITAQDVSYTVAMDSIGGTPGATVTTYVSNDAREWAIVGSPIVFNSAKKYWHTSSTVPGVSDSAVTVNTNPWTGQYIGIKVAVTGSSQRAQYHIKVKSCNTY